MADKQVKVAAEKDGAESLTSLPPFTALTNKIDAIGITDEDLASYGHTMRK